MRTISDRRHGAPLVFLLSFLSVLTCGIGCFLLLLVIIHGWRPSEAVVQGERSDLEAELARLERRMSAAARKMHRDDLAARTAAAASGDAQGSLERGRQNLEQLESELPRLRTQEAGMKEALAALRARERDLAAERNREQAQGDRSALEAELGGLDERLAALSEQAKRGEAETATGTVRADERQRALLGTRRRADDAAREVERLRAEERKLQSALSELRSEQQKLVAERGELKHAGQLGEFLLPRSTQWQAGPTPIIVECRRDGIVTYPNKKFEPSTSLEKTRSSFRGILDKVAKGRSQYLLFLVRPDGFATFAAARQLASAAQVEMGWEPVPQDLRIEIPEGAAEAVAGSFS